MAPTPRKGLPETWVTHAAKYLVGEQPCLLRVWLPSRFKFDKVPGDEEALASWKVRHTELMRATIAKYQAEGWKCSVERYVKVPGATAVLAGKADLITQKSNCRPTIRDCKGGKPEDSDVVQVQVYQIAVPLAWHSPGMQFDGTVIYNTHDVPVSHASAMELKPKLFALLRRIGSPERPEATPSEGSCKFCPVPKSECPDRIDVTEAPVGVLTTEW